MGSVVISDQNHKLNEDISMFEPFDFIIRETPFTVTIWFNKDIENYEITTNIDDNPVNKDFITYEEFDQQEYYKYHRYDPAWWKGITNQKNPTVFTRYWKLSFTHYFNTNPMVNFTLNYNIVGDATSKSYTWVMHLNRYAGVSAKKPTPQDLT